MAARSGSSRDCCIGRGDPKATRRFGDGRDNGEDNPQANQGLALSATPVRAENIRSPQRTLPRFWRGSTNVPGISAITAQTILCEIGTDVSRFRNASAFASWLGLCPEKKISGGKVLYTKSRRVRSRVASALRMGAHSLHHPQTRPGDYCHSAQAGTYRVPLAQHKARLRRERVSPMRRRYFEVRRTPATCRGTRISSNSSSEWLMFLGSRLHVICAMESYHAIRKRNRKPS